MLRLIPFLIFLILIGPIFAGLMHMFGPAFSHAPMLGIDKISLNAFFDFFNMPGIFISIWLSFWIGLVTTLISLLLVILFVAGFFGTRIYDVFSSVMRPVVAVPHAAAAFALAFLIMPSGFFIRLVSPELSGFSRPPDWLVTNDPMGFALLFGLVIKEIIFILLVVMVALAQVEKRYFKVAQTLGYGKIWGWLVTVFPKIYKQIRLPILAVIAYSTSVVDVALILGPNSPPTLAIKIIRLMNDADLSMRLVGAAAAVVQLMVTLLALLTWLIGEKIVAHFGKKLALSGFRLQKDFVLKLVGISGVGGAIFLIFLGLGFLAIWSVAGYWAFPDILPQNFSFNNWIKQSPQLIDVAFRAINIAFFASFISVILVLFMLENEYRRQIRLPKFGAVILYMPLMLPQVSFLFGLSILLLWFGIDGTISSVIFVHIIFVLPYVYLLLVDGFHGIDIRLLKVAKTFGKSNWRIFFSIRLPLLLRVILMGFALGFAISIAQYLPTLLIGAGRVPTITTEAVALASGGNRRLIGIYALVQSLIPFIIFALAAIIPALVWRNKEALK